MMSAVMPSEHVSTIAVEYTCHHSSIKIARRSQNKITIFHFIHCMTFP